MWTRVCAIVSASAQGRPTFFSACVSRTVTATSGVPLAPAVVQMFPCDNGENSRHLNAFAPAAA